jgi:2-polyprenyl-3-methyl-5-hydroxy-6-metoxy-1,4-benzoquinol methylase
MGRYRATEQEQWWDTYGATEWYDKMFPQDHTGKPSRQQKLLVSAIEDVLEKDGTLIDENSFLDVGCGYGRMINFLASRYLGIDIAGCDHSTTMLDKAEEVVTIDPTKLFKYNVRTGGKRAKPYQYDIVFTNTLLIHISTKNLKKTLRNMLKLANKYVLHVEGLPVLKSVKVDEVHAGCWRHNIVKTYKELGKYCEVITLEGANNAAYVVKV